MDGFCKLLSRIGSLALRATLSGVDAPHALPTRALEHFRLLENWSEHDFHGLPRTSGRITGRLKTESRVLLAARKRLSAVKRVPCLQNILIMSGNGRTGS